MNDRAAYEAEVAKLGPWAKLGEHVDYEPAEGEAGKGKLTFHWLSDERLVKVVDLVNTWTEDGPILDGNDPGGIIVSMDLDYPEALKMAC